MNCLLWPRHLRVCDAGAETVAKDTDRPGGRWGWGRALSRVSPYTLRISEYRIMYPRIEVQPLLCAGYVGDSA